MTLLKIHHLVAVALLVCVSCSTDNIESPSNEDANENEITEDESTDNVDEATSPNILLIIADDMGLDASPGYNLGSVKPNMPILQNLINTGVTFNNLWAYPTCTPTRASMLTGKYGFRTNVLKVDDPLATSETSIQRYIDENSTVDYSTAVIGKWHLSRDANHPTEMGIDHYAGFLSGGVQDYSDWTLVQDGATTSSNAYTTTKFTDLAIDWIGEQTNPWFLWVAYNAPHTPFHIPPSDLHSQGSLPEDQASIDANPLPYYMAALEAMDTEMGRLLDAMSQEEKENTIILFIGDNGTPNQVRQTYPNRRVKGTVYQGGINVPMVVSGAHVSRVGQTENALIGTSDIFATIAELAETGITEIHDSKSFKSTLASDSSNGREFVYTEIGNDEGTSDYTIRNATHKYISFSDGSEALFNLSEDPLESTDLLNANQLPLSNADSIEKEKLINELNTIRG